MCFPFTKEFGLKKNQLLCTMVRCFSECVQTWRLSGGSLETVSFNTGLFRKQREIQRGLFKKENKTKKKHHQGVNGTLEPTRCEGCPESR